MTSFDLWLWLTINTFHHYYNNNKPPHCKNHQSLPITSYYLLPISLRQTIWLYKSTTVWLWQLLFNWQWHKEATTLDTFVMTCYHPVFIDEQLSGIWYKVTLWQLCYDFLMTLKFLTDNLLPWHIFCYITVSSGIRNSSWLNWLMTDWKVNVVRLKSFENRPMTFEFWQLWNNQQNDYDFYSFDLGEGGFFWGETLKDDLSILI